MLGRPLRLFLFPYSKYRHFLSVHHQFCGVYPAPKFFNLATEFNHPSKLFLFHNSQYLKQFRCWALTACTHTVSGSISLPSPGFFSPFPHGTGSLSVSKEYLALEDGPPIFSQSFTCSDLLVFTQHLLSDTGLSPSMEQLSICFS